MVWELAAVQNTLEVGTGRPVKLNIRLMLRKKLFAVFTDLVLLKDRPGRQAGAWDFSQWIIRFPDTGGQRAPEAAELPGTVRGRGIVEDVRVNMLLSVWVVTIKTWRPFVQRIASS